MSTTEKKSFDETKLIELRDEIASLRQKHFSAEQAAAATLPAVRHCPSCGGTMERGRATIHGGPLKGLFVFLSTETLSFDPQDGRESETVVTARHSELAWRCAKCHALLIEPGVQRVENP